MGIKKSDEFFRYQLKKIWKGEFTPLTEYKGHNIHIKVRHEPCGKVLIKTPRNLIVQKYGCRSCRAKENALKINKDTQWFKEKVFSLVGDEYIIKSNYTKSSEPITLFHTKCNKEFQTTPDAFLGSRDGKRLGRRCAYCSNKWKRSNDDFKKELTDLYGDEFKLIGEYNGRLKHVTLFHKKCENILSVRAGHFISGRSYCPFCTNTAPKNTEEFKREVSSLTGDNYKVIGEYINSKTLIPMYHKKCKTVIKITPDNFLRGRRCSHCYGVRVSLANRAIYEILSYNNIPFEREYKNPRCKHKRELLFDFAIYSDAKSKEVIKFIEFDGDQHKNPIKFFGGIKAFNEGKIRDKIKDDYAKENGIPLIRIDQKSKIFTILKKELTTLGFSLEIPPNIEKNNRITMKPH